MKGPNCILAVAKVALTMLYVGANYVCAQKPRRGKQKCFCSCSGQVPSTLPLPGVRLICPLAPFLQSYLDSPCFTGIVNSQGFLQAGLTVQNGGGAGLGLAGGHSSEPAANRDLGRRRRAELRPQPEPCQSPPGRAARPVGKVQRRSWGRGVRTGLTRVAEGGQ